MKAQAAPFNGVACHAGAPDGEAEQVAEWDECQAEIVVISGCGHCCRCGGEADGFSGYGYLSVSCQRGD